MEKIESSPAYMKEHGSAYAYHAWRGDQQAERDAQTQAAFLAACRKCDANAMATWVPTVSDREGGPHARRAPAFHEVLAEALDFTQGPTLSEVMQLLLNVGYGADVVNAPAQARALLERMAAEWTRHCGPEVE